MNDLDPFEDDESSTVFRDVIMLALLGFVAIVILLLPHLNPPIKTVESAIPPGNIIVEVRWPDEVDTDVDLWVEAPGDKPVGYSNLGGLVFDMLRDDRGHYRDISGFNYEVAYSRGAPSGEYTINLHLYSNTEDKLPVSATVIVSVRTDNKKIRRIASKRVTLSFLGEERTVMRFSLDDRAVLVPGSVHELPRKLRSTRKGRRRG